MSHKRASVLLAGVGATDLQSAGVEEAPRKPRGPGPIAAALDALSFDEVVLLDAWKGDTAARYAAWLRERTKATVTVRRAPSPAPPTTRPSTGRPAPRWTTSSRGATPPSPST